MKNPFPAVLVLCALVWLSACGPKPESAPSSSITGPAGVPDCPGLLSVEKSNGDEQVGTSTLLSSESPDRLLDFYTSTLAGGGWVLGTSIDQGEDHHLLFRQGSRFLRVQIGPDKSGATLDLIWGYKAGSEPVRESVEPEFEAQPEEDDGGGRGW